MDKINYQLKRIDEKEFDTIKELFYHVFTDEPWKDDWSNSKQLNMYIHDLIGQSNSLTFGMYEGEELVGLSMGRIKHWYSGTEYCIDELCIKQEKQGQGIGTLLIENIQEAIKELGLSQIFLQTESTYPAYEFYKKNGFYELKSLVSFGKQV